MPRRSRPLPKSQEQIRVEALEHARSVVERTPEDSARFHLASYINSFKSNLDAFAKRFAEDPHNALSWGAQAFEDAARCSVYVRVNVDLEAGHSLSEVLREWRRQAELLSRHQRQRSTSPTANLAEECERIAVYHLLEELESIADRHAHAIATLYCDQEEHCASVVLQEQVRRALNAGNPYYTGA